MKVSSLSICICTYNRAGLLARTLEAMQGMLPPGDCRVEIVVVDNNSTDVTARVVAEAARMGTRPVIYLHEPRQGKSFALNTALDHATGDVVALTDDDVVPGVDWATRIVERFRQERVSFVFGKALPRWAIVPPPELLTVRGRDIWGPLGLVDYGDVPAIYVPERTDQSLPIGANVAFQRSALVRIGGWRTDLGKVNNSLISGEDHEIFSRLKRQGLYSGYYDPEIVVRHYVPAERLTRRYFRRWFYWHGKTQALMLDDWYPDLDLTRVPVIAGVPRFIYRLALRQLKRYVVSLLTFFSEGRALKTLVEELRLVECAGLMDALWARWARRALRVNHSCRGGASSAVAGASIAVRPDDQFRAPVEWKTGASSWQAEEEGAEKC